MDSAAGVDSETTLAAAELDARLKPTQPQHSAIDVRFNTL
jgi:hypothetical protein